MNLLIKILWYKHIQMSYIVTLIFIFISIKNLFSQNSTLYNEVKLSRIKNIGIMPFSQTLQMHEGINNFMFWNQDSKILQKSDLVFSQFGNPNFDKNPLKPLMESLKCISVPLNKVSDGAVALVFDGKQWYWDSRRVRVDGLVYPTGTNLSGNKKRRLTAKSKVILTHSFGLTIE